MSLFELPPAVPEGFGYWPDVLAPVEEREVLEELGRLPFREFQFHGFEGKRRVVSYGWAYDFNDHRLREAEPLPDWLLPVRDAAARAADRDAESFPHVLITEYAVGAAIGWHRDRSVFGDVIGVSLLSPCTLRFRRGRDGGWERLGATLAPRSAYLLAGPARSDWEHSIAAAKEPRYSLTFRTLRAG